MVALKQHTAGHAPLGAHLHSDAHNVGTGIGALLDLQTDGPNSARECSFTDPAGRGAASLRLHLNVPRRGGRQHANATSAASKCSPPAARRTCSTVAAMSRVSVVVMVCSAMRCALPTLTGPICRRKGWHDH